MKKMDTKKTVANLSVKFFFQFSQFSSMRNCTIVEQFISGNVRETNGFLARRYLCPNLSSPYPIHLFSLSLPLSLCRF